MDGRTSRIIAASRRRRWMSINNLQIVAQRRVPARSQGSSRRRGLRCAEWSGSTRDHYRRSRNSRWPDSDSASPIPSGPMTIKFPPLKFDVVRMSGDGDGGAGHGFNPGCEAVVTAYSAVRGQCQIRTGFPILADRSAAKTISCVLSASWRLVNGIAFP